MVKRAKTAKNLYLDSQLAERGEAFAHEHGVDLSHLVNDFLRLLELRDDAVHGPIVQRLIGAAVPRNARRATASRAGVQDYKQYLLEKHGGRRVAEPRPKRSRKR
jgi:hypothetical protein